jgi:hypothetical protein
MSSRSKILHWRRFAGLKLRFNVSHSKQRSRFSIIVWPQFVHNINKMNTWNSLQYACNCLQFFTQVIGWELSKIQHDDCQKMIGTWLFRSLSANKKVHLWPLFNNDHLVVHSILHCFLQIIFQSNCVPILSRSMWKLYLNCKCKRVKDFLQSRTLDFVWWEFSRNLSISHSVIHVFFSKKIQWQEWE